MSSEPQRETHKFQAEVNQLMGVVTIEWGEMVPAAGNEQEPWYDEDNVVGSEVWKPRPVIPGTIRYNTVVLSNLPVDADRLHFGHGLERFGASRRTSRTSCPARGPCMESGSCCTPCARSDAARARL